LGPKCGKGEAGETWDSHGWMYGSGGYRYRDRGRWFTAVYKQWVVEVFNFDSTLSSRFNPRLLSEVLPFPLPQSYRYEEQGALSLE